jgi:photosystem II stability/assembly factor-like uncharacterized protein
MSVLTPQRPPRSDDRSDVEALEALIEEARRRARQRRRWYAACTLVAAAAALLGYFGFDHGGGGTGSQARAERDSGGAGVPSQGGASGSSLASGLSLDGAGVISALLVDPQRPRTIFAATYGGVLKSTDGGRSWRAVNIAPTATVVDSLVIDPQDSETVYVGTEGGVFKSTDGGATWQPANTGLFGKETVQERSDPLVGYVYALVVDESNSGTVYAARESGLFKSTNGGDSWRRLGLRNVGTVVLDPKDPETIYAGAVGTGFSRDAGLIGPRAARRTLDGVFKSSDGGSNWRAVGLQGKSVGWLALDPEDTNIVYAGTWEYGVEQRVFKSSDGGSSWRAALEGKNVDVLTFDPQGPDTFVDGLTFDPQDPDTVYANVSDAPTAKGQIIKSTDGARTWRALDVGQAANFLALHPRNSAMLYALSDTGLLISSDAGRSWRGLRGDPFWKALSTTP